MLEWAARQPQGYNANSFQIGTPMSPLATALQSCDMLLIDGLHAFDFTSDESGLTIECMDGRQLRRWTFTPEQITAAIAVGDEWQLDDADGAGPFTDFTDVVARSMAPAAFNDFIQTQSPKETL